MWHGVATRAGAGAEWHGDIVRSVVMWHGSGVIRGMATRAECSDVGGDGGDISGGQGQR